MGTRLLACSHSARMTSVLPCCNSSKALPSFSVLLMIILQLIPRLHHGARKKKIASCLWDGIKCNEDTSHVIRLDLTSSCLHGSITPSTQLLSTCPSELLQSLQIVADKLATESTASPLDTRKLPPSVGNLTKLNHIYLSGNDFSSELPASLGKLSSLKTLEIILCNFSGKVPDSLGNLTQLNSLTISVTNFSEQNSYSFVELSALKLQANNFYGIIPQTFMNGTNLMMIDFSDNSLQGRVPKSLANCVKLKFLNLGDNQITDVFPSWLGTLPELEVFILKFNNFHGEIEEPQTGFEFPKLRIIDLSHNRFTAIILSDNNFVGEIPASIASLKGLRTLNLSNNNLRGYIPLTL
ncbi:hypothetical protein CUMW_233810, partial [Citrus unshiu]